MTEFSLICAICGGAIQHQCPPQSAANLGAIQQQNGQIAQEVLTSDPAVTKDGRQPYNQGYPEEFEVFWKVYPMRKDKRKSLKAWRNAVRRAAANPREAMAQILAGAIRYRDDSGRLDEYTKYAEGWLNGDRWLDDPLPVRLGGKEPAPKTVTEDDYRRTTP